jgi:hypothetical protein
VDSILVFPSAMNHVAWVTGMSPDGSLITITEMNVRGLGVVDTRTIPTSSSYHYIVAPWAGASGVTTTALHSVTPTSTTSTSTTTTSTTAPAGTQSVVGFTIEDDYFGGTWARTDPNNGTWYPRSARPPNGAYFYPNGLGVGVNCAVTGASYVVHFGNGTTQTWSTWFHVTDGKYFPAAAALQVNSDGFQGLPSC